MQATLQEEACTNVPATWAELPVSHTEQPKSTVFLWSEPTLKEFLELYFNW